MLFKKFLPMRIGTHWQNIGNRYYTLVTINKSLVEVNMCKLLRSKIYKCFGRTLPVIDNQYLTNQYLYIIPLCCLCHVFFIDFVSRVFQIASRGREFPLGGLEILLGQFFLLGLGIWWGIVLTTGFFIRKSFIEKLASKSFLKVKKLSKF